MTLGPRGRSAARQMRARLDRLPSDVRTAFVADLHATAGTLAPGPTARLRAMLRVADPQPRTPRKLRPCELAARAARLSADPSAAVLSPLAELSAAIDAVFAGMTSEQRAAVLADLRQLASRPPWGC